MHGQDFDDLSRRLWPVISRHTVLKALTALGISVLTRYVGPRGSDARTHNAMRPIAAAKKNKKKKKKKLRNTPNNCPQDKKNAVCHCPPGQGGANCKINCVGTGGGHDNHPFDCMCGGKIKGVPPCAPGRCPDRFGERSECGGPEICLRQCSSNADCPFASVADCACNSAMGLCGTPCVPDGGTATFPIQCCSATLCAATGRCGACTCAATCTGPDDCTGLGVEDCLCRTVDGQCGQCVPDGDAAGSAAECCSGALCVDTGLCGACTTCTGACTSQTDCTGLGTACVCRTLAGQCGPCILNGRPAGSAVECCSGQFCEATGECGACVCVANCSTQADCSDLGVEDCVCHTVTGQCGACIDDGGLAGSEVECCSGSICGNRCGTCPPQICGGPCTFNDTCQAQADQCVCFASGTCAECLTNGAPCSATGECCGQLKCIGGECKIAPASGGAKGKRGSRGCIRAGRPCRLDGQCCAQSACFQGKCGEKDTHCRHDRECAPGYRCEGGRSIGSHRRCRKKNSRRGRRNIKRGGGRTHR